MLMSARFTSAGGPATIGVATPMFKFDQRASSQWDLTPDGTRFLVNELVDAASSVRPYNVMIGWKEKLEQ